jgi:hypothetical protein
MQTTRALSPRNAAIMLAANIAVLMLFATLLIVHSAALAHP